MLRAHVGKLASLAGSERSSAPTLEQVIGELYVKGAQAVLSARINQTDTSTPKAKSRERVWVSASSAGVVPGALCQNEATCAGRVGEQSAGPTPSPQFNVELEEVKEASRELNTWRQDTTLPLVVEVGARAQPWGVE